MTQYGAEAADHDSPAQPAAPPQPAKRRGRPPIELSLNLIMPSQFFPEGADGPGSGEKRLMFAVLREALGVLLKYATAEHGHGRRLFVEAKRWLASNDTEWPCSFVSVCETLGFDPACIRKRLTRCQAAGPRGARKGRRAEATNGSH